MMKSLSITLLIGLVSSVAIASPSVRYVKVRGTRTVAHTVTIDLTNPGVRVSVALARDGSGSSETFKSIIERTRPYAAITGTFFDTKTLIPTGDIALFGTVVHSGCIGSALCIDSNNKPAIVPLRTGREHKWTGYETVLCAGPTLIAGGKLAIALKHEGFRRSLHSPSRRTAVGITRAGKLLLVAVNRKVSLYDLAKLMLKLNVTDAVSLDGGSSTAFYHTGRFFALPARTLTNCLVVYSRAEDYMKAKTALAPAAMFAKAENKQAPLFPELLLDSPLPQIYAPR